MGSCKVTGNKKSSKRCQLVFSVSSVYHGERKATDSPQPETPSSSMASTKIKSFVVIVPKLVVNGDFCSICKCLKTTRFSFIFFCLFIMIYFPQNSENLSRYRRMFRSVKKGY